MRLSRISLALLLTIGLSSFLVLAKADTAPTLSKSGVTLSLASPVYTITSSTSIKFNYTNNSGYELFSLGYELTDRYGTVVAGSTGSAYTVKSGTSGIISDTWYSFEFAKATAPYTLTMKVSYGYGSGKTDEFASTPFEFIPRVAVAPTPAPTVTVTAMPAPAPTVTVTAKPVQEITDWALMESLKAEVAIAKNDLKAVNAKLKKICSAKPKPKGC
jgi:hypothetical protein